MTTRREVLQRLSRREIGVEEAERMLSAEGVPAVPQPVEPPKPNRSGCGCGCGCLAIVLVVLLLLFLSAVFLFVARA